VDNGGNLKSVIGGQPNTGDILAKGVLVILPYFSFFQRETQRDFPMNTYIFVFDFLFETIFWLLLLVLLSFTFYF